MPNIVVSGSSLGDTIQTAEIDDAAITAAKLGTGTIKLISTQTLTAASSVTWTGLTGKRYLLIIDSKRSAAGTGYWSVTVNDLASGYEWSGIKGVNAVISDFYASAQAAWNLSSTSASIQVAVPMNAIISCSGDILNISAKAASRPSNCDFGEIIGSNSTTGQTSISKIVATISSGAVTGLASLYELK